MSRTPYRNASILLSSIASSLFAAGAMAQLATVEAPTVDSEVKFITQLTDQIAFGSQVLSLSNPSSTQRELPGLGHKFELLGVMVRDADPENLSAKPGGAGGGKGGNEGISATMTPTSVALALRNTPPGVKIAAFNNQLGFKYYFVAPRSCGGGSPRLTLLVDANGDGSFDQRSGDFAAHGHPNPFVGCPSETWVYENLTDEGPRWEVTPGGVVPNIPVFPFSRWDTLEAAVTAAFPNHKILAGFLVDDSCSFFAASCGKAHYDLVTVENRTLEIWQDTVKNNGQ